nr:YoaK family protein [Bradyrhizobium elkanii]
MPADTENPWALPLVLSLTAGYVDTAGFLALQGLFTAHVTGNFVTLGASLALGTSGAVAKLLALPVFCVVVIAIRLIGTLLSARYSAVFEAILGLKVLLLLAGAALAINWGPFENSDSWQAVVTGMVLVAAMAVQNAAHRAYLGSTPPSTLMTGTTTQIMIDLADTIYGKSRDGQLSSRMSNMTRSVIVFAVGCGAAALLYARYGVWCFVVPPGLAAISLLLRLASPIKT